MFGIGAQEIVLVGLLLLVVFGPSKTTEMARDLGRFTRKVRDQVDEVKGELTAASHSDPESEETQGY